MSSQSAVPDAFGESRDILSDCSCPVEDNEYHRGLLWQQVWEYLIQECRERAARRRAHDDISASLEDVLATPGAATMLRSPGNHTRSAD